MAYFFLRAATLAKSFGFLAINTIAQGDTREVGLDALVITRGWRIVRAVKSRAWPGEAGIHISQLWISENRPTSASRSSTISGQNAISLASRARRRVDGKPYRLAGNAKHCLQRVEHIRNRLYDVAGRSRELMRKSDRNAEVLFPYLNADDICSRPDASPSRWVINFIDWPLEEAEAVPGLPRNRT